MTSYYDSPQALQNYLLLHYGDAAAVLPYAFAPQSALDFPVRCVQQGLDLSQIPTSARALELGCAVGRLAFELSQYCADVVALDYSQSFISAATQLQQHQQMALRYALEGDLTAEATIRVPTAAVPHHIQFVQGDAQQVPSTIGQFDVLVLANLIDRLTNPRQCLKQLSALARPGAQLLITSPYTWLESYTPKENWLGGFYRDGQAIRSLDTLKDLLKSDFVLQETLDLPFLIREHARKFQWSVAEASRWIRK